MPARDPPKGGFAAEKRLRTAAQAGSFCAVADRGMVSQATIQGLEAPGSGIRYILGCRMRRKPVTTAFRAVKSVLETRPIFHKCDDTKRDLTTLREVEIVMDKDLYFLRTELRGCCFDVRKAAGIAVPRRIRASLIPYRGNTSFFVP